MTTPSPICTINGLTAPQDVTANSTVTIALANAAGANYWSITAIATDETNSAAAINATLSINQTNKTATFTSPAAGSAVIFKSVVGINGLGLDANGQVNAAFTTTFKVNVKAANGQRVLAANEVSEQSSTFGWATIVNPILRGGGAMVLPASTGLSAATSFSLSAAQQATPILQLTGTVGSGGTTITLPNTVGSVWIVDLSAVTLTGGLTFSTGSGTTATVSSTDLGSHKRLVTVAVSASNVVSWG